MQSEIEVCVKNSFADCWEYSFDLIDLIMDPRLKTAESPQESQPAVPTPTAGRHAH